MPRVMWMCVLLPNLYALLAIHELLILLNLDPGFSGVWGLIAIAQFCLISAQLDTAIEVILSCSHRLNWPHKAAWRENIGVSWD